MNPVGLLICGHGSRDSQVQEKFYRWAEILQRASGMDLWQVAYLEFAQPDIPSGARILADKGAKKIIVLPALLMGATHTRQDIPAILQQLKTEKSFASVCLHYAPSVAGHPLLTDALVSLVTEAMHEQQQDLEQPAAADRHLLLITHGSSDERANQAIVNLARQLHDRLGFEKATACFSKVCPPSVEQALDEIVKIHIPDQLVVIPYFLLPGPPVQTVYSLLDQYAVQYKQMKIIRVPCLQEHPLVIDAFVECIKS